MAKGVGKQSGSEIYLSDNDMHTSMRIVVGLSVEGFHH